MVPTLRVLLNSALSSGSRKLYQRAWALLNDFYQQFYHSISPALSLTTPVLALFVSYLHARKLAPSTIKSYLLAIGYVHKWKGLRDPTRAFITDKLLTALSHQGSSDIRLPILRPVIHALVGSLNHNNSSAFHRTLFSTMFLIAIYGFFRIGELEAKNANSGGSVVQFSDMRFLMHDGNIHMLTTTITNFKHNTDKRPFVILSEREDSMPFCPVQAMLDYCKPRATQAGPLFCHSDTTPITMGQFNTERHRCLSFCGLGTSRYKGHSFRIGAASHAAEKGFSDAQNRTLGRWKSDAFKLYIRYDTLHAN